MGSGKRPDALRVLLAREVAANTSDQDQFLPATDLCNDHQGQRTPRVAGITVGQVPDADPYVRAEGRILAYGFNSPFEEVALAMELSSQGIETTYPRAIYMTGRRMTVSSSLVDHSRYESHSEEETPDGQPILSRHHEYLTIWGYWNGPDDALAARDEAIYKGIDALAAYRDKRLTKSEYFRVVRSRSGSWRLSASRI